MMSPEDLQLIAEATGGSIRAAMAKLKEEVLAECRREFAEQVKALPAGPAGKDATVDLEALAERAASLIKAPRDGKDADPVDVDSVVLRVAELIPRPKDAPPVDEDSIVARVLLKIPPPENGKDAPPVDVDSIVLRAAELIRRPENGKDGKDADESAILQKLGEQLRAELEKWERPKDGKDGKDAPPVDTAALAAEVLRQVPTPENGRDADPEVVKQLVTAEVQRAVSSLPAPKDGEPGKPGRDGESIHPDTVALMVRQALDAVIDKLPFPKDGPPGTPGRDAIHIEILPAIDVTKSYPRGTAATHAGGTIYALRNTDPITDSLERAGWTVLCEGIAEETYSQSEDFTFIEISRRYTSGKVTAWRVATPIPHHRQIFKLGTEYYRGNMTTWGGSTWLCVVDKTTQKPGPGEGSTDWILAVKRGNDGKDKQ